MTLEKQSEKIELFFCENCSGKIKYHSSNTDSFSGNKFDIHFCDSCLIGKTYLNKNFDFITARAVGSLSNLIKFSIKFCKNKTRCIFLKGKSVDNEIKIAKKKFIFQISYQKSITNNEGKILIIENIRKK